LITDAASGSLARLNLATGARTLVSSFSLNVGTGPDMLGIVSVVRDTRPQGYGNSVLALVGAPSYSLMSVDLANGTRTILTDLNGSSIGVAGTPALSSPRSMLLDPANGRVYFSDTTGGGSGEALYAINFQDLTRSTLTSATHGAGPSFDRASTFVLDISGQQPRALVADEGPGGMLAVDLATGNRSVFLAPWAEDPEPGASVASATFLLVEFGPAADHLGFRPGGRHRHRPRTHTLRRNSARRGCHGRRGVRRQRVDRRRIRDRPGHGGSRDDRALATSDTPRCPPPAER
jgi:hypothetical protein